MPKNGKLQHVELFMKQKYLEEGSESFEKRIDPMQAKTIRRHCHILSNSSTDNGICFFRYVPTPQNKLCSICFWQIVGEQNMCAPKCTSSYSFKTGTTLLFSLSQAIHLNLTDSCVHLRIFYTEAISYFHRNSFAVCSYFPVLKILIS